MKVRVAVTGRIVIVTLIGSEPTATTPAGRASATDTVSLADTPVIGIGTVSTRVRAASWSASPATSATCGSTVTDSISKPAAGVPVMTGLTGSVRLWRSEKTGMTTRAVGGVTSSERRAFPSWSTGTSWASWSTSRPDGWMRTSARAATTLATIDSGPDTVTFCGSTTVSPRVSPSGTTPCSTWTGTLFDVSGSSRMLATAGS